MINSYYLIEVIYIYKDIVKKYINLLTLDDIKGFADEKNISYTNEEAIIVYNFIMYYYNDLLDENIKVFEVIKNKISPTLYKQLLNLYIEYKQRYL